MLTRTRSAGWITVMLVFGAWALPGSGYAQRVAIRPPASDPTPTTVIYDFGARRVVWSAPGSIDRAVFTSDGRYLLYWRPITGGGVDLILADTTGSQSAGLAFDFEPSLAHGRAPAIYGLTRRRVTGFGTRVGVAARLDPSGLHEIGGCPADTTVSLSLSPDHALLALLCESGAVVIVDAVTGAARRTIAAGASPYSGIAFGAAATVVVTRAVTGLSSEAVLLDAVSGATLATSLFPAGAAVGDEPCGARVVAATPDGQAAVLTCARTVFGMPRPGVLQTTRVLTLSPLLWGDPLVGNSTPRWASVSPDGRRLTALWGHPDGFGSRVLDVDLASGVATTLANDTFPVAMAYAPSAPALTAHVAGAHVELSWTPPPHSPAATSHVLEVGSAPGLSDLGTLALGPSGALGVPAVPPGTYYVRVRAGNTVGLGAVSNEVTVAVPQPPVP